MFNSYFLSFELFGRDNILFSTSIFSNILFGKFTFKESVVDVESIVSFFNFVFES